MYSKLMYVSLLFFTIVFYSLPILSQQYSTDIEHLTNGADIIITGKVIEQNSIWNKDKTRIYTQATIQVEEYLKGSNNNSSIIVNYPGGEIGDIGEIYSHMPRFENNEEVLVFLKKDEMNAGYKVFNGEEGKISVINDPKTGEKVTTSNVRINSLKAQIKSYTID